MRGRERDCWQANTRYVSSVTDARAAVRHRGITTVNLAHPEDTMSATSQPRRTRPNTAPAYYLGRPATWWLTALHQHSPHHRTHREVKLVIISVPLTAEGGAGLAAAVTVSAAAARLVAIASLTTLCTASSTRPSRLTSPPGMWRCRGMTAATTSAWAARRHRRHPQRRRPDLGHLLHRQRSELRPQFPGQRGHVQRP